MRSLFVLTLLAACSAPMNPPPDAGPTGCTAPAGAGKMHGGSVNADETWTEAESPHVIPSDMSVYAKLTLEPCAVVTLAAGRSVTVNANGSIVSNGTADRPVTWKNAAGAANWANIRFIGGTGRLSYTTFENGGDRLNTVVDYAGALDVRSGQAAPTAPDAVLFVDHVTIKGSASQGVRLQSSGAFTTDSTALTITGSAGHAMTVDAKCAGSLPPGTYTGNTSDDIVMLDGVVQWDMTLKDRGVPYLSSGSGQNGVINIQAATGSVAVLTVEPGVVWKFKKGTGNLQLDPGGTPSKGVLVAKGTTAKAITFTSEDAAPAAGDWLGIWMGGDDVRNSFDYVNIRYAGKLQVGSGSNSCQSLQQGQTHQGGALRVYHVPPATLVQHTTFSDSATNGIDRGWRDNAMPSLLEVT
jgi:hypothetical protein